MPVSSNTLSMWLRATPAAPRLGEEELARLLISYRRTIDRPGRADLADDMIERLVSIAFHASLMKDEGRYPLFRLFAPAEDALDGSLDIKFVGRQQVDVESLRRLAAAFDSATHALVVGVEEDELWCHGAISIDKPLSNVPFDQPAFWGRVSGIPGFVVIAEGPGELTVSEGGLSLQLIGGSISEIVPVSSADAVRRWASTTAEVLSLRFRGRMDSRTALSRTLSAQLENMLFDLLARILEATVYQRHGGAIALLPKTGWQRHLHFKYPASGVDVGRMAMEYWEAFLLGQQKPPDGNVRQAHIKRDEILLGCKSLARIANVDGCVGLSEELALWGFGGEILVSEAEALESPRIFWDLERDQPWPDQSGADLGGARHRSAYRLCKAVANCLVFVVSEDGQLTLIASDEHRVHGIRGLTPVRHSGS